MVIGKRPSVAACRLPLGAVLMKHIYEIMDLLKCTRDQAFEVYILMDINLSECTEAEFKQSVYRAWEEIK